MIEKSNFNIILAITTYRNKDGRNGAGVVDICVWLASRDVRRAMFVERLVSGVMWDGVGLT